MAKGHDRKGRSINADGKYTPLYEWMMKSPAWQSLDVFGRCVYIELRRRFNGKNNGAIVASMRDLASAINSSVKPVVRAIKELQDRGFIVAVQKGSFNWKTRIDDKAKHRASVWLLTELPQDEPERTLTARKDFMQWKPKEKNAVVSRSPYGYPSNTIEEGMVVLRSPMVVPEQPFSSKSDGEWLPSDHTYNIPYTPSKDSTDMEGGHE